MEQAGSACYICYVSSREQSTIPVVLGTCPAWIEPAVVVISAAYPDRASDYTSSIGNVSCMERDGSDCFTCSVSSKEQATMSVVLGTCPAWSGRAVLVIHVVSPV